jgi:hypothetical protein
MRLSAFRMFGSEAKSLNFCKCRPQEISLRGSGFADSPSPLLRRIDIYGQWCFLLTLIAELVVTFVVVPLKARNGTLGLLNLKQSWIVYAAISTIQG